MSTALARRGRVGSSRRRLLVGNPADPYQMEAVIPAQVQTDYGGAYPLTYAFELPAGSSGLTAQWRAVNTDPWTTLTLPAGRFDGVAAGRFDYPNNRAYLSVPFTAASTRLFLRVVDGGGNLVGKYLGIPKFYDNRRCAVVSTWDDWNGNAARHAAFRTAAAAHRDYKLWFSPGINAAGHAPDFATYPALTSAQWAEMTSDVAAGYLEPTNHGHTHKGANDYTGSDADTEIGTGGQAIKDNVTMPPQSRRGTTQYLQGFIEPFGQSSASARARLGADKYLGDRSIADDPQFFDIEEFDRVNNLYPRQFHYAKPAIGPLNEADATTQANEAKTQFDTVYARRGIYVLHSYPHHWPSWSTGSAVRDMLSYIGGFTDIWAVGLGHVYQYRILTEKVSVETYPQFVGIRQSSPTTQQGIVDVPPGEIGDLLVAYYTYSGTGGVVPNTWTVVADSRTTTGVNASNSLVAWRIADGTEHTRAEMSGSTDGATLQSLVVVRYRGVDWTAPIDTHTKTLDTTSGTTVTAPAATATGKGVAVRVLHCPGAGRVHSPTAELGVFRDHLWRADATAQKPCWVIGDSAVAEAGTVPAVTGPLRLATGNRHGWTVVLKDATAAYPATVLMRDTVTRADSATMGTADTGQTWQAHSGGGGSVTNNKASISSGTGDRVLNWIGVGATAYTYRATYVKGGPGNTGLGLAVRVVDQNNYWMFREYNGNGYIVRSTAGTETTVATLSGVFADDTTNTIAVKVSAGEMRFYRNDKLVHTETSMAHNTATNVGWGLTQPSALNTLDDFLVLSAV